MARKGDENHVVDWWNEAYEEMVKSGEYRQLCKDAVVKHGQ